MKFGWRARHFETRTSADALRRGDKQSCEWHRRLPALNDYDVVVSDNLPEVLHVRDDAVLQGSFLWHLALEDVAPEYLVASKRIFAQRRPPMVGTGLFAAPELTGITCYEDVGLIKSMDIPRGERTDLLIACGRSGNCEREATAAVSILVERGPGPFDRVQVEPRLLPDNHPGWMRAADFTPVMYSRLAAAVVRPGVGTLTEALEAGCLVYCFYEEGNQEMAFNAAQIELHGLGFDCRRVDAALSQALSAGKPPHSRTTETGGLSFDGATRAARYLLDYAGL